MFAICQVLVYDAAKQDELTDAVSILHIFAEEGEEALLEQVVKSEKFLVKLPKLKDFYEKHCRSRQYIFQVKTIQFYI